MTNVLELGKVPSEILRGLLSQLPESDGSIVVEPSIGCDAAGIKLASDAWAVTTDPITFSTKHPAKYSVCVNINDIACMGCRPKYFSSTILLPRGTTEKRLLSLWRELMHSLCHYGIQNIGGHLEVTEAVNSPVIVGQMMGELAAKDFYNVHHIEPGDQVLLWRSVAIEGTALLAYERVNQLKHHILEAQLKTMQELLNDPGICVLPAAEKLFSQAGVVALHDPTEGGVATALHEMAEAAECGLLIDQEKIPVLSETQQLAEILKFDPLGLLASGSLLIACRKTHLDAIMSIFSGETISHIGEFTKNEKRELHVKGRTKKLPCYTQDEIVKAMKAEIA